VGKAAHPLAKPDGSCLRTALTCSRPVAAPQTRASLRATRAPIRRHPSERFKYGRREWQEFLTVKVEQDSTSQRILLSILS